MQSGTFQMFILAIGPDGTDVASHVGLANSAGISAEDRSNFRNDSLAVGVPANAQEVALGFRLTGPRGTGWVDVVRLEVTGDFVPLKPQISRSGPPKSPHPRYFHGGCAQRQSWLSPRGLLDRDELSLTKTARRSALQGVQVALSVE